jgi:hypothetical protein
MRRRKLLVALVGLAVVAATVILLWLPRDPITLKNFDRILKGMTRAEVKAILGPPNITGAELNKLDVDDFEPAPAIDAWGDPRLPYDPETDRFWLGNAGAILVTFENDRAEWKAWRPRAGPLTRLRGWWHRWFP